MRTEDLRVEEGWVGLDEETEGGNSVGLDGDADGMGRLGKENVKDRLEDEETNLRS